MKPKRGLENPTFEKDEPNLIRETTTHCENLGLPSNYLTESFVGGSISHSKSTLEDSAPPWQPAVWTSICKHSYCPTYQNCSRCLAFVLIGLVSWYTLYIILGETVAPPKGPLFQIIIASGSAMLAGWLVSLTNLPGLIGMLVIGAAFQNLGIIDLDESFSHINKFLRGVALIVILVRAGLGLDPSALRRLKWAVFKLGILPWLVESILIAILAYYFLEIPWYYGFALGFAISAISPAVTVPCLLRMKSNGYGVTKGIPTLVMAITTLTDVFSVVCFGIIQSLIFSNGTLTNIILQLPVSIFGGIGVGLIWGVICSYYPESHDSFSASLRVLMLLAGGILSIFGSDAIGYGGAGPLACVVFSLVAIVVWTKQGWTIADNPVDISFKIFWIIFEPVLFAITGAQIKLEQLDWNVILIGSGILIAALLVRIVLTIILGIKSNLNLKEKLLCSVAMSTKATVQAALAPVLIGLIPDPTSEEYKYAEKVMMICILSIILTAPPMAIFMEIFGTRLLTKDSVPLSNDPERRSLELSANQNNQHRDDCVNGADAT